MKPVRTIPPFSIRLPPELRERLEAHARQRGESLNSLIVQLLGQALAEAPPPSPLESRVSAIERRLAALEEQAREA